MKSKKAGRHSHWKALKKVQNESRKAEIRLAILFLVFVFLLDKVVFDRTIEVKKEKKVRDLPLAQKGKCPNNDCRNFG